MTVISKVRISQALVRVTTSYSRQEVYDEIVWLVAHDATDDVLRQIWQLIRPNAVILPPLVGEVEPFALETHVIEPIERPKRHHNGH